MAVFFPVDNDPLFPMRASSRIPQGLDFPIFKEWNVDSILDFAKHIVMVPDLVYHVRHPPCEPKIYRFDNVPKPYKWSVYITDSGNPLAGEGIYPDHIRAHSRMPEQPHFAEDDDEHYPLYHDEKRNGDDTFVRHGLDSIEAAREEWASLCNACHQFRWDAHHASGRMEVANLIKENMHTTKCMLVIKAMAELYPALVIREMRNKLPFDNDGDQFVVDPFTAQTNVGNTRLEVARASQPRLMSLHGAGTSTSEVESGTLHPIIEPLGKSLWVITDSDQVNFESLRQAYLYTQHVTNNGKKAVVVFSRHLDGARKAFEGLMGKVEDAENDVLMRERTNGSRMNPNVPSSSTD
ncbi:hypothetical protein V5O48_008207 [Marasmius crinis-equi]|uniref:Uncharacterized protein n=1 Tax=Marasmius crinis-equi TaxID=585013 RepID=A0ABR3FEJ3_9AGAR